MKSLLVLVLSVALSASAAEKNDSLSKEIGNRLFRWSISIKKRVYGVSPGSYCFGDASSAENLSRSFFWDEKNKILHVGTSQVTEEEAGRALIDFLKDVPDFRKVLWNYCLALELNRNRSWYQDNREPELTKSYETYLETWQKRALDLSDQFNKKEKMLSTSLGQPTQEETKKKILRWVERVDYLATGAAKIGTGAQETVQNWMGNLNAVLEELVLPRNTSEVYLFLPFAQEIKLKDFVSKEALAIFVQLYNQKVYGDRGPESLMPNNYLSMADCSAPSTTYKKTKHLKECQELRQKVLEKFQGLANSLLQAVK